MPRTKQQRPRHIPDEIQNEDSIDSGNITSHALSSSAGTSPDGAYATDSGIESNSHHPNGDVSDCPLSVKSDYERGALQQEDAAECSVSFGESADSLSPSKDGLTDRDEIDSKTESTFVSPASASQDSAEKNSFNNQNYVELLRSIIAQNITDKDTAQKALDSDSNFNFFGQTRPTDDIKNGMLNPIDILRRLLQESTKTNQPKTEETATGKNTEAEYNRFDKTSRKIENNLDDISAEQRAGGCSRRNEGITQKTQNDDNVCESRPHHSSQSQDGSPSQERCYRAKSTSPSAVANGVSYGRDIGRDRYSDANTLAVDSSRLSTPITHSKPVANRAQTIEGSKIHRNTDTAPLYNSKKAAGTPERQRMSPYANMARYETPPLYNSHRRTGSRGNDHEKLLAVYPYPPAGHSPFAFPLPGVGDYSRIPQHPYYNPWSFMYPTYHPALPSLAPNPFLQQYPKDSLCSKPQNTLPHRVSPHTPEQNPAKKTAPRSKCHSSNPIDSFHAAIVREAKEMNKGTDPENMYIECPICHKRIKRLYHFQRHMRIHSGEKSHTCPFCPYKSVRKDNLKSHMKTHEKSKYDGSRRVQNRRYSQNGASFPNKTDLNMPDESSKGHRISPVASHSTAQIRPYCKTTPPIASVSNLPYLPQQESIYHQVNGKDRLLKHHNVDLSLLASPRYYPDPKLGFSYTAFPPVHPAFMQLSPPPQRADNRESHGYITEISDDNSPSPKSRNSSKDERSTPEKKSSKRPSQSPTTFEAKRPKSWERDDAILLGNTNNSNNLDLKPTHTYSTVGKDQRQSRTTPEITDDSESGLKTKLAMLFQDRIAQKQNGESLKSNHALPLTSAPDHAKLAKRKRIDEHAGNEPGRPAFCDVTIPKVEGSFLSFAESPTGMPIKQEETLPSRRTSLSSLESVSSIKQDLSEESKRPRDSIKADTTNPSSWNGLSRELKCRLCDFLAAGNSSLQEHMSTHKEDGQYKCPQCEYHGKNLSKLIEHIRIHTGERPFQCDQCSYAAKRKDNLAQHKSVKHDKSRSKAPARILKLAPHDPSNAKQIMPHPDYASILLRQGSLPPREWSYLKSGKGAEAYSCFPSDWYSKLSGLPFGGHMPFAGVVAEKNALKFAPGFLNIAPQVQHPTRSNISSTT